MLPTLYLKEGAIDQPGDGSHDKHQREEVEHCLRNRPFGGLCLEVHLFLLLCLYLRPVDKGYTQPDDHGE